MVDMSRKLYNALSEALSDRSCEDDPLRDDYSGRYMYGSLCLAMTCPIPDFYAELYRLSAEEGYGAEVDEFFEEAPTLNWDSLGLGTIFYFPDVHVEGAGEYEDDEDEEDEEEEDDE